MKKIFIIIVVIIIITGGGLIVKLISPAKEKIVEVTPTPSIALPTVSESISVQLKPKSDNKIVSLTISGLKPDIESIEYELTYLTGTGLPRGVLGKINLKGEKEIRRDDIVLGTCSSGKCVYDTGVTSVDLSLKFNLSTGTSEVFQKTYPF